MAENTYHIHLSGQVQGVGFRPFVLRLATENGLKGWVNNAPDGVHVEFNADEPTAQAFYNALRSRCPQLARITEHSLQVLENKSFADFRIVHSDAVQTADLLLSPDFALCADCRHELHDPADRRYRYPFITCTNCGPRFSVSRQLPYDRERTTMHPFQMCADCRAEYENMFDRRYFSQTNSCPACGVRLQLRDSAGYIFENPLETAVGFLKAGKIVAVKSIGGYLLLCDATDSAAIEILRARKHRPAKPLAVLYANDAMIAGDCTLSETELQLLKSTPAPIVLLPLLVAPASGIQTELLALGLDRLGVMLPNAPLLDLLAGDFGKPLVATSGNISGSPILYEDEPTRDMLAGVADYFLSNDRDIVIPQDDSVVQFGFFSGQKIILRRSRGYALTFLTNRPLFKKDGPGILAMGAKMKSAFAWLRRGNVYLSQYLGDLGSFDKQEHYERALQHFLRLFGDRPQLILTDKHPDYFSTQMGERLAAEWNIPLQKVQHHKAHFAAVLGENDLLESREPVLGVIWDGTGLGDDGQIWGGEFFTYQNQSIQRFTHFDYFDLLLGDKMPREPRLSALSTCHGVPGAEEFLIGKFSGTEWSLYQKMLQHEGERLKTSSVGRLFDGVAALLGALDKVSYEGEAALWLENRARRFFRERGLEFKEDYFGENTVGKPVNTRGIVQNIVSDLKKGKSVGMIAAKFHNTLVRITAYQARLSGCLKIAFSGGVFQNSMLEDLMWVRLRGEFELHFHQDLSPNDESISFGQLVAVAHIRR